MREQLLLATPATVLRVDPGSGTMRRADVWPERVRPTGLASDPWVEGRAWCSTHSGLLRTDDGGATWQPAGLTGVRLMTVAVSAAAPDLIWAGADPSAVWKSVDAGESWDRCETMEALPSSSTWAFPPKPETHHVRWLLPSSTKPAHLWAAIEAGALVRTEDGGETWIDRVPDGPYDTHELAAHPDRPLGLRSAAGDGYFESDDGGASWTSPMHGLDVSYLRSVAIDPGDPGVVLVSGATGPRTAYVSGRADGLIYRRVGEGPWTRVLPGGADTPRGIAPLLIPGRRGGEFWAADDRGVHFSDDGGIHWSTAANFDPSPDHLRGLSFAGAGRGDIEEAR